MIMERTDILTQLYDIVLTRLLNNPTLAVRCTTTDEVEQLCNYITNDYRVLSQFSADDLAFFRSYFEGDFCLYIVNRRVRYGTKEHLQEKTNLQYISLNDALNEAEMETKNVLSI